MSSSPWQVSDGYKSVLARLPLVEVQLGFGTVDAADVHPAVPQLFVC